jgi:hypothetical protein
MVSLLMPCRIEIVEPFTRVRDFDHDNAEDGIELLLQAVNSMDNPGLQIVGGVRVELYEFVEASAEKKGRRIDQWSVDLSSVEQQQKHWNQLTQMYEFKLEVDPAVLPRRRKFVLAVTYNTPQGIHLVDECVIEYELRGLSAAGSGPASLVGTTVRAGDRDSSARPGLTRTFAHAGDPRGTPHRGPKP